MSFRARLLATLRELEPVLAVEGVMVVGSQVPNLLQPAAASTFVVSQGVDIGIPVGRHREVKDRLRRVSRLRPAAEEPSVRVPDSPQLLEANFVGLDAAIRSAADTYVLEDDELPLLVFGPLGLLRPAPPLEIEGVRVPLPRPAGLLAEKLLTERSGVKGDRDLLVALGLLLVIAEGDLDELTQLYRTLGAEERHAVRSNLAVLSLLDHLPGMPDPRAERLRVAELLGRLEREDTDTG